MIKTKAARYGLVLVSASLGVAQGDDNELKPLSVLARKFETSTEESTASVVVLTQEELERMQLNRLVDSLNLVPGAQGLSTAGQMGNLGTALLRGLSTKYVQIVVDGVRITDATNGANNFLGAGQLGGVTRLEVLRGPQSVLYGSGAAGGVIGYDVTLGSGEKVSELTAEAGSFGHFRASLSRQGQVGDLQYAFETGYLETENDPYPGITNHDYEQFYRTIALQWQASDDLQLRFTYRGSENELRVTNDFGGGIFSSDRIDTDVNLVSFNAEYAVNPWWQSRLTLGVYDETYDASFGGFLVATDYSRYTANWNNQIELNDRVNLVTGIEFSKSDYETLAGRNVDYDTLGVYVNGTWRPIDALLLEGGVRYEDHNVFQDDFAWSAGFAYDVTQTGTRIRGRVSEAYRTPTLLESEGFTSVFGTQLPNPNLESEDIFGYEFSVEQDFGDHRLELGFFQQRLRNAIVRGFVGMDTQQVNRPGNSRVSGVELAGSGSFFNDALNYRVAATKQNKEEVLDVPDFQVSADLSYDGGGWLVGVGATYVEGATYGLAVSTDDRIVTRLYGEVDVTENLRLFARVENLFDENYLLSNDGFTPVRGIGRSLTIGASLQW